MLPWFKFRLAIRLVLTIKLQAFLHRLAGGCVDALQIECLRLVFYCIIDIADLRTSGSYIVNWVIVLPVGQFACPF